MTLILSHWSTITGLLTVSDIAVSRPVGLAPEPISLPFRDGPAIIDGHDRYISDFAQKTVIFGRTMLMYTGPAEVAKAVIKAVRLASQDGNEQVNLPEIIDGLNLKEDEESRNSFIYHFRISETQLHRIDIRCQNAPSSSSEDLIGEGSGVGYFAHNLSFRPDGTQPDYVNIRHELLSKIVTHALLERFETDSLGQLYGGWFELAFAAAKTFTKVPYGIKLWARKDGMLASGGPGYLGWYSGHNLIITRFQMVEDSSGEHLTLKQLVVPDLLRRDDQISAPMEPILPFFVGHLLHDKNTGEWFTYLDTEPTLESMVFQVSSKGFRQHFSHNFRTRMLNLRPSDEGAGIFKNWDPPASS